MKIEKEMLKGFVPETIIASAGLPDGYVKRIVIESDVFADCIHYKITLGIIEISVNNLDDAIAVYNKVNKSVSYDELKALRDEI